MFKVDAKEKKSFSHQAVGGLTPALRFDAKILEPEPEVREKI